MNKRHPQTYPLLKPISWIYGLVVWWRNLLYDINFLPSRHFPVPVISVGNITVGGTGKTPHIEYLVRLLYGEYRLAVLSRGYRRKTRNFIIGNAESTVTDIGDEPLQIKHKFPEVTVAVDNNRCEGINRLLEMDSPPEIILLDDAYQHRRVKPGLNILLIDYHRPLSRDYLLPCGRLREHASEKHRADIIVITKCPEKMTPMDKRIMLNDLRPFPYQQLYFSTYRYGLPCPVFPSEALPVNKTLLKTEKFGILLVTGIANNRPLRKHIRGINPKFRELRFPDHHYFSPEDLRQIEKEFEMVREEKKLILTTEKDATRFQQESLPSEIRRIMYYIPVEVEFLFGDSNTFTRQIEEYARKDQRNRRLHQK